MSAEILYGADGAQGNLSKLYILSPSTGAVLSTVGPIGFAVTGLAIHPTTGVLYGSTANKSPNSPAHLITINKTTGAGAVVGAGTFFDTAADGTMADLTFTSDGVLYGSGSFDANLYRIDLATGKATKVGDGDDSIFAFGAGLAANASNTVYLATDGDSGALRTVDRTTGLTTEVVEAMDGDLGLPISALAFNAAGVLYGALNDSFDDPPSAELITINVVTGHITVVGLTIARLDALVFAPGGAPTDTTPPNTAILDGPTGTITVSNAAFTWTGTDDTSPLASLTYAFRLDPLEPAFSAFGSATSKTYTGLPNGTYTFFVKARDQTGNEDPTPASQSFTVNVSGPDTLAPETSITTGPTGTITVNNASFSWTGLDNVTATENLTYAFRLAPLEPDFSAFGATTTKSYTGLANGDYTFFVKAKDLAGNEDASPASRSFTVSLSAGDTTPPDTAITGGPSGAITVSDATFTWTGTDDVTPTGSLTYAFRLDPLEPTFSPFDAATSKSYTGLSSGITYTFLVRAKDQSGNVDPSPASRSFTVEASPVALAAAVLPSSRSVEVGTPATAFVTIINAGASTAAHVGIALSPVAAPSSSLPINFGFQTTDPATNALIGTPNTAVDIAPGHFQSYVISLAPTSPFPPTDVAFSFAGSNTLPVPTLVGINTLLLSASSTPVADIVALAATIDNNGIVTIPAGSSIGAFAVATVNVGAAASITASADTGAASVPVSLTLCQTNPATGQCLATPGPTVTTTIGHGETPTFAIFVTATAFVPFDPAQNRIFVRFKEGAITRGSTSVAVRTQ